nr:metalloprotease [Halegenticoccus tardaugens]
MSVGTLRFSARETRDLVVAWLALGVAFAVFFAGGGSGFLATVQEGGGATIFVVSLLTAGVAFLLHELAHKVVAVRFGQVAEFRADYGMLFLAVMSAMIGFLFAAPGAVHHRGMLTKREHGLIALAGPVTNLVLGAVCVPIIVAGAAVGSGLVAQIGQWGLGINLLLAAFNMIPYGPLDGRTVLGWSKLVWALVFFPSAALAFVALFVVGLF